jgi:hypothetical protein
MSFLFDDYRHQAWLVKTYGDGNVMFTRLFGGPEEDGFGSGKPTTGGGYILAGYSASYATGGIDDQDAYLVYYEWDPSVLYVPDDYATIQEAIDAAKTGDTVLLRNSVYTGTGNKDLDFGGKVITVASAEGPWNCVIDCEGTGRGFHFHNGETGDSVLRGIQVINGSAADGGAILCEGASPRIEHCMLSASAATGNGGAVACLAGASPTLVNMMITGNTAAGLGGALFCQASSPGLTNATLSDNTAASGGGGLYVENAASSPTVINSILWGDTPNEVEIASGSLEVTYSDVQGGWTGEGNLDADPLFADAGSGDYHLTKASPCVGMGSNSAPELPEEDLDGEERVFEDVVDMGADEMVYHVYYVPDAFATIQDAIDAAVNGDIIIVRDGLYTGDRNKNLTYNGKSITVKSENGPSTCIIDCEGMGNGFYFNSSEGPDAVIDGFTVTHCAAGYGAGMYLKGSPVVANCVITENTATSGGAGMGILGNTTIRNCVISNNVAGSEGGGISFNGGGGTVTDTVITGNEARYGGGVNITSGSPIFTNCLIADNTANEPTTYYGGAGMMAGYGSNPHLINCTFYGNQIVGGSGDGGGLFMKTASTATIVNSIFWANQPQSILTAFGGAANATYSDVEGGWTGDGNFDADPLFVSGPNGDTYLSQTAAGQGADSPCLDAGDLATSSWDWTAYTTRTDQELDENIVDMGYHPALLCTDEDEDGFALEGAGCGEIDCDDNNADRYPGAPELCNGVDDDCDSLVPADEEDGDSDDYRICEGDCDDGDAGVNPGAAEECTNGRDDDCDGLVDSQDPDCGAQWTAASLEGSTIPGSRDPGLPLALLLPLVAILAWKWRVHSIRSKEIS